MAAASQQKQKTTQEQTEPPPPAPAVYGGLGMEFWAKKPLIGMVHLGALPGSARYDARALPLDAVLKRARTDAQALVEGGADAIMVENFFDAPFAKDNLPPHTVAALTRAVCAVREVAGDAIPIGVNALRNDARTAIGIAHICDARFVRINVYVGAAVTDQGIIEGAARTAVLYRRELGANVAIFADVFVKHATQLGDPNALNLEDAARDAAHRGMADAIILSGVATGAVTPAEDVRRVQSSLPKTPLLVGSGMNEASARTLIAAGADGAIVGTSIKRGGDVAAPVDAERVRRLRVAMDAAARSARSGEAAGESDG